MAIIIRNQNLFCTCCGCEQIINYPVGVKAFVNMSADFEKLHRDCKQTWTEPKADMSKPERQRAEWWFRNGTRGLSSLTMYNYFTGNKKFEINHPHDPDDFSRCYKLLQAVPEWRPRIKELSGLSKPWENIANNWDKLTEMFEENERTGWKRCNEIGMYEFMQKLISC